VGITNSGIRFGTAHVLRAINIHVQIQMIIPHRIAAESCDVLRQPTIKDGSGGGSRGNVAVDPGIPPCRCIVSQILDGRIVVEVQAVNQFPATPLRFIREANIGIVASEMVVLVS